MSKKRKQSIVLSAATDMSEGDGVDPREEKRQRAKSGREGKRSYASLRLASQVMDSLNQVLVELENPLLYSFAVSAVEPSSSGSNFVVQVYSTNPAADYNTADIKAVLEGLKPVLRAEVAKDVCRKNAPDFKFDVLPPRVQPK